MGKLRLAHWKATSPPLGHCVSAVGARCVWAAGAAHCISAAHLGTTLTDVLDDMGQDILEMCAQLIAKNNELTHPSTKFFANKIFNTLFYGATLWDFKNWRENLEHVS